MNVLKKLSPRTRFCVLFSAYITSLSAGTYATHKLLQEVLLGDQNQVASFNEQVGQMVGGFLISGVSFSRQVYSDITTEWHRMSELNENMKKTR